MGLFPNNLSTDRRDSAFSLYLKDHTFLNKMLFSLKIKKKNIFSEGEPEEIHFSENDGRKKSFQITKFFQNSFAVISLKNIIKKYSKITLLIKTHEKIEISELH